ncbi:MAG: ABC transporter ATP-binding protein [Spirochaetales bacterium]|nr:ABC transporter ATP-binding protein [Candidatus Physcosoma equi]
MSEILRIDNLSSGYGKTPVIKNLTLTFDSGRLYALIGPNGSGKSTLLKTILKETKVTEGTMEIEGKDVARMEQRELSTLLSFVPQSAIVPEGFTVEEVLEMVSYSHGPLHRETIQKALRECGIEKLAKRKATELSGGELQLVLLARAITADTPLILLDEPTSNLDINNQSRLLSLAKDLTTKGKTVLMTVHDLNSVFQYSDEVIVLKNGVLYDRGTPTETITEKMLKDVYTSDAKIHQTMDGRVFIG